MEQNRYSGKEWTRFEMGTYYISWKEWTRFSTEENEAAKVQKKKGATF